MVMYRTPGLSCISLCWNQFAYIPCNTEFVLHLRNNTVEFYPQRIHFQLLGT